jgi:hypothetical protein
MFQFRLDRTTAGAGIKLVNLDVDYAMSPQSDLGSTQRITLKKKF